MIRAINSTTDYRTNFRANFVSDAEGLLQKLSTESHYNLGISCETLGLADKFHKQHPGHQLEVVDIIDGFTLEGLLVKNNTTGKTDFFAAKKGKGYFWDNVLNSLLDSGKKGFYEK